MQAHQHQWGETFGGESDGEYAYIYQECDHTEILQSRYSEKWDEDFYDYGDDCDVSRTHVFRSVNERPITAEAMAELSGEFDPRDHGEGDVIVCDGMPIVYDGFAEYE